MDGLNECERKEYALVEDAARTYPLADTPPGFAVRVMARLQKMAPVPHFRLSWLEYLLSLGLAGMGLFGFLVWSALPPQVIAYVQNRLVLSWKILQLEGLEVVLVAGGLALILMGMALILGLLWARWGGGKSRLANPLRLFS
ncbi:MAG: hypothetical protein JXB85_08140 [Anaerolineales bacterium]|nr:hypothetical protein [Anaerolineales bacterium]